MLTKTQTLVPHFADRPELEGELHIAETEFALWRVQGLLPPKAQSEAEQQWKKDNKATPYEVAEEIVFFAPRMIGSSSDPVEA